MPKFNKHVSLYFRDTVMSFLEMARLIRMMNSPPGCQQYNQCLRKWVLTVATRPSADITSFSKPSNTWSGLNFDKALTMGLKTELLQISVSFNIMPPYKMLCRKLS